MRVQALGRGQQKKKTLEPYMLEIFLCFHWALPIQAKGCSVRVQALGRGQQKMKTLETNSDIGTPSPISGPISGKVPDELPTSSDIGTRSPISGPISGKVPRYRSSRSSSRSSSRRAPDEFRYRDTFPDIGPDIGKGAPISELPILKP